MKWKAIPFPLLSSGKQLAAQINVTKINTLNSIFTVFIKCVSKMRGKKKYVPTDVFREFITDKKLPPP